MNLFNIFNKPKKTTQKVETIEGINFKFKKNSFSKSIKISVKSDNSVLVSLPKYSSFKLAREFALKNLSYIKKNIKAPQALIYKGIEYKDKEDYKKALKKDAKKYLPIRLEELSKKYDYKYNKLSLRYAKTRWGSCSYNNNISLNIALMKLNEKYIDYVLLHELVHTKEKNHSKKFYDTLEKHMPEARLLNRELKKKKVH